MDFKKEIVIADLEAIGLLDDLIENDKSTLHCLVLTNWRTNQKYRFFDSFDDRIDPEWLDTWEDQQDGDMLTGVKLLNDAGIVVMHNSAGYDYHAFEKTCPGFVWKRDYFAPAPEHLQHIFPYSTCDTLVLSRVLNPERKLPSQAYQEGKGNLSAHTIEAFGLLFNRWKPDNEDWTRLTDHMIHRCSEDTEIGKLTFDYLLLEYKEQLQQPSQSTGMSIKDAYMNELRVAFTMAYQAQRGFRVDVPYIKEHILDVCDKELIAVEKAFRKKMPQRVKRKKWKEEDIEKKLPYLTMLIMDVQGCSAKSAQRQTLEWEMQMFDRGFKGSAGTTYYDITLKSGAYSANVRKFFPEAIGMMRDYETPPLAGPCTPYILEDIPLGNRDEVKQLLYQHGWRGVNLNDTEREHEEEYGELPKPWSGKIDDKSIEVWEEKGDIPSWCKGIAEWYIYRSRRTQWLNPEDIKYFDDKGVWKTQKGKKGCRGILPRARLYTPESRYGGITLESYYEENGKLPETGEWRVPAEAFHCATNTFRMRHKCVVNIPSRGLLGHEMRRSFIAKDGYYVLGCDGAGLELRMLAHFMNDQNYIDIVLDGDIHTYNMEKAGLTKRDFAKTFIYAFLYGSGIPNLARSIGGGCMSEDEMKASVDRFKRELPALAKLLDGVEAVGRRLGYLVALDGRRGRIRRSNNQLKLHTALNVLLQMAGSLVMKYGHVIAEDMAFAEGLIEHLRDFPMLAHQHDEAQMEVKISECDELTYVIEPTKEAWKAEEKRVHIDDQDRMWSAPVIINKTDDNWEIRRRYHRLGEIYATGIERAGKLFKMRIPTAGEYMIGESWADTH